MAVIMPLTFRQESWRDPVQFGRYSHSHSMTQRSPIQERQASTLSLERIAALIQTPQNPHTDSDTSPFREEPVSFVRPVAGEIRKCKSFPTTSTRSLRSSLHRPRAKVQRSRSVRFADTQGLPLTSVRNLTIADPFETEGEIVPYGDLGRPSLKSRLTGTVPAAASPCSSRPQEVPQNKTHTRKIKFLQPGTQPDFYNRVQSQRVCLESVRCEPRALHGIVRVLNLAYEKEVLVRWTHDQWSTQHDTVCCYCPDSSDGTTDRFAFTLPLNGDDVSFAVCYRIKGHEYWDSNNHQNYLICVDL